MGFLLFVTLYFLFLEKILLYFQLRTEKPQRKKEKNDYISHLVFAIANTVEL